MSHPSFHVVIPARYGSTRLPGKPLRLIGGRPMIRWVCENAQQAGAREVIVATDDERICDEVNRFGGVAMMTSNQHRSGTDRIAEVCKHRGWPDDALIVNLQGDEPGIPAALIARVAAALEQNPLAGIATLAVPIDQPSDLFNPNVVKLTCDANGMALYFSRAPIPFVRDRFTLTGPVPESLPPDIPFLRHLGLYAYRAGALRRISSHPAAPIEIAESLEQLRAMAMGIRIHVSILAQAPGHGVDTEEDLQRVEQLLGATKH